MKSRRDQNGFTPTQARIAAVLEDGKWHTQKELLNAIDEDGLAEVKSLGVHLTYMRRVIATRSEVIVSQFFHNGFVYRHARRSVDPEE